MEKLDFQDHGRSGDAVAYLGGDEETALFRARVVRDDMDGNPFTEWDGHWPMLVYWGRHREPVTMCDMTPGIESPLARFTDGQIVRHQKKILAALGDAGAFWSWKPSSIEADFAEFMRDQCEKGDDRADWIRDYCERALEAMDRAERWEALEALYDLLGIPCLSFTSRGYSQGDWAEVLIVATPEAEKSFGHTKPRPAEALQKDMEGQRKLFDAWAWGDVYGFILERAPEDADERDDDDAWEHVDSCWGFYGDDPEWSGIADAIREAWACAVKPEALAA